MKKKSIKKTENDIINNTKTQIQDLLNNIRNDNYPLLIDEIFKLTEDELLTKTSTSDMDIDDNINSNDPFE